MFHPVGSQPPSVYWRRRLILLGSVVVVVVLIALTVSALSGGGSSDAGGSPPPTTPPPTSTHAVVAPTPSVRTSSRPTATPTGAKSTARSSTAGSASTAALATCSLANLQVAAVVGKSTYKVGDEPLVALQVTNVGSAPCTRNLADSQIVLSVYNGTSRVWGSHDCAVQPGTSVRTLAVGQPYRFAIQWGGLTSAPKCAQMTRQRVGAGTYTLYASLAGKSGKAAQFNIS
jgi:hypothetical protein